MPLSYPFEGIAPFDVPQAHEQKREIFHAVQVPVDDTATQVDGLRRAGEDV